MKVNLDESVKNQITMEVEVPFAEMDAWLAKAAQKVSKKVNIPGFRKGKIPRAILENYIGMDALLQEAVDIMVPQVYWDVIEEHNIEPVDHPKLDIVKLENNQPVVFKAVVTVKPQVVLGEYKGVEVNRVAKKVTEKDVAEEVERMRVRAAKIEDVTDGQVENGDFITLDFEGFIDGAAFPGGKAEKYALEIGSASFIPGFEEQLIGFKVDEDKEITVTFPGDYHQADFAGKEAVFKVKVRSIRRKDVPELNEEFVKNISETCDTVAELEKETLQKLEERASKRANDVARNAVITKVVEACSVDIPEVMIEQRAQQLVEELKMNLERQGLTLEKYMEYASLDADTIKKNYLPQAENGIKYDLVMEAISEKEDLYPSGEEINEQIEAVASAYFQPADKIREQLIKTGRLEMLIYSLRLTKAAQLVFDQAKITDVEEEAKEKAPEKEKKAKTGKTKAAKTVEKEDTVKAADQEEEKSVKKTARKTVKKENPEA